MNLYCFFILTLIELIYDSTGLSQDELGKIVNNYSLFFSRNYIFFRFMNYRIICNKDKLSNIVIL